MTIEEDLRFCAVCGRTLEQWRSRRDGEVVYYKHAIVDEPTDHPPVAVRLDDAGAQHQGRCDFCFSEPVTHALITDRELRMEIIGVDYGVEWSMCPTCAQYVMSNDWLGLRRHAFAGYEAKYGEFGEQVKTEMRVLYRDLREAVVMVYQHEEAV